MNNDLKYAMVYEIVDRLVDQIINDDTSEKYC